MTSREIVRKAIKCDCPPRLPFWQHGLPGIPDDICECAEMDRAKTGWFFGQSGTDDWGCGWSVAEPCGDGNMGQVVHHPLDSWDRLLTYLPPNPREAFYFNNVEPVLRHAGSRYVMLTCHFNLFERLHMLRGFSQTLEDFCLEPENVERILDMILDFKLGLLDELHRRFPDRIDGIFFTDDWGSQTNTFVSESVFQTFFFDRYRQMVDRVHGHGWHFIFHTDGRVNSFIPHFIELGMDVLNLLQPLTVGIESVGSEFAGKIAFLSMPDIQHTLPLNDARRTAAEAHELVRCWATPSGGFIVANCGDGRLLGMNPGMPEVMYRAFAEVMDLSVDRKGKA